MAEIDSKRAKMLGDLIQKARTHTGHSVDECAQVLHVTADTFREVEEGAYPISLPELEALALYLNIPMGYFWGSEQLPEKPEIDFENLITLRHRMIGVLLSQLRLKAKKSVEEVAEALDLAPALLKTYESGQTAVPYLHLEQLTWYLHGSIDMFLDDVHGPMGRHEAQQRLIKQLGRMSPEMQAFFANPVNVSYLETAKKISEMDVAKLRQVAENILEITY